MKKLILSQVGRYCPHEPKAKPFSSLFHSRYLSTSDSNPFVPIQPVSYPVKPKEENKNANENENQELTREDIRYVKDAVSSHPSTRVAPLPEYKKEAQDQEIEGETRKIEAIRFRRVVEEEETVSVPFPRLIKPVKKETRPLFDLADAIKQLKANARTTFDETVEAHVRLGIPKSRSDLIVRGTLSLPHGGKKVLRIAVFAEGADADEARAAGADVVGGTDLIDQIARDGKIDFDKCFTTTQIFPRVVKLARILNRHGLMPDAKQGTVVKDVSRAVKQAKLNQIKFKMDKTSIVHVGLGKVSFSEESLRENVGAFMNAILQAKPAGLKKTSKYAGYVNTVHICSTMGPGFPVSIQSLSKAVDHYNKVHLKSPA
ncbi:50S ribosomal protein L1 isoform X1 [Ricinus communis]|uniref:50S ribosomal protein L1 isoform X1 n=1 Tax=Ricinus communis TaxID=3988 RepID=UPI00201AA228|nr:50S ribosomal protein L1 isoform X1 [Ricinus communis]